MPEEFVIPIEKDSKLLPLEESSPLILRLEDGNHEQGSVNLAKIYTDSLLFQNQAIHAIQQLSPADRQKWRGFQIEIAGTNDETKKANIQEKRNAEFPEIAKFLNQAQKHIDVGTTLTDTFLNGKDRQPSHNWRFSDSRPLVAERSLPSKLSVSPEIKALIDRELKGGLLPGLGGLEIASSNPVIINKGELHPGRVDRWKGIGQLNTPWTIKPDDSKPSFLKPDKSPGSRLFDFNTRQRPFHLLPGRDQAITPDFTRFLINEPDPMAVLQKSAEISLAAIDKPGRSQLLDLKSEEVCQLIASKSGGEVNEARLLQDLKIVNENKKLTKQQKLDFLTNLTRMVEAKGKDLRPESERAIIAAQLVNQASNIRTVDQGPNKTCNTGVIEKIMLVDQPDVVARMVADIATTFKTKTESGRVVKLDPKWLAPHKPERLKYPPADEVRSMASHYYALIGVDVRFQLWNEEYNSNLKFAHVDGKDQVQDFSEKPPKPVYSAKSTSGKFETDKKPVMLDDKPKINSDLQVIMKKPSRSPHVGSNGILDMYEDLSGKSGDGKMIGHKSEIDYVDRAHLYTDENELHEILKKLALDNSFPAIFDQPGHVVTINGYDIKTKTADYDNQWGDSDDKINPNGASLKYLMEKGLPDPADEKEDEAEDNRHRKYRKEYEDWCKDLGIKPDSRYPTTDELKQWRSKKS